MPQYNAQTTGSELVAEFTSNIKGKVVLTTGVSPGSLGATFVETIAQAAPALLILAGRNTAKIDETADALAKLCPNVQTRTLQLDLGSLRAVRDAAATVRSWADVPAIDVLVNNAGIMAVEYGLSPDGVERQFATNHLGHFLFTNLLMDKIMVSGSPRIANVSSSGHRFGHVRFDDYNFDVSSTASSTIIRVADLETQGGKTYNRWTAYGQSKTAIMLTAISLAEKLGKKGLLAFSLHPGGIYTNLGSHIDWTAELEEIRKCRYHT